VRHRVADFPPGHVDEEAPAYRSSTSMRTLSEFYALVENDPDLSWASRGAGRMLRTPDRV
jgi:hypothetical protein